MRVYIVRQHKLSKTGVTFEVASTNANNFFKERSKTLSLPLSLIGGTKKAAGRHF